MDVFGGGRAAAAPKSFPPLIPNTNLLPSLGVTSGVQFTWRDLFVFGLTIPLLAGLTLFVMTLLFNIVAFWLRRKYREVY